MLSTRMLLENVGRSFVRVEQLRGVAQKALAEGAVCPPMQPGRMYLFSMRFCPYAQRVLLVLYAKNLTFSTVNVNLSNKPSWFLTWCPTGKVPLLRLPSGRTLSESVIIAEFLDEAYPGRRMTDEHPYRKANDRLMVNRFQSAIRGVTAAIQGTGETFDWWKRFHDDVSYLETELLRRDGLYFAGSKPGMADYMLWPFFQSALALAENETLPGLCPSSQPRLKRWAEALLEDNPVKRLDVTLQTQAAYFKSVKLGAPDYDFGLKQRLLST